MAKPKPFSTPRRFLSLKALYKEYGFSKRDIERGRITVENMLADEIVGKVGKIWVTPLKNLLESKTGVDALRRYLQKRILEEKKKNKKTKPR